MEKWEIQVIVSMIMLTRYSCTNNEAWRLARLHVRTCDVIKNALLAILPIVCRPLNIIGAWFRALLKPLGTVLLRCSRGFILYWVPMISRGAGPWSCTQRNLFEILLNQTEIGLYLPFSDWFGTKRTSFWFQIHPENGKYNLISVWFNKISKRFLCVCGVQWDKYQDDDVTKCALFLRWYREILVSNTTVILKLSSNISLWKLGQILWSLPINDSPFPSS